MNKYLIRQAEIIPVDVQGCTISIVGAGAVGSFAALALAKMGYLNLTVYDMDKVDDENMNCQFYRHCDIGKPKVEALRDLIKDFTGHEITIHNKKVTKRDLIISDYVIFAVDSMSVRKMLFQSVSASYIIDPRMSAEYASLYVTNMLDNEDKSVYAKSLYSDDDAVAERCTAKSTMYTVLLLSGQITKVIKDLTTQNDYIWSMDWDIKRNEIVSFKRSIDYMKDVPVDPSPDTEVRGGWSASPLIRPEMIQISTPPVPEFPLYAENAARAGNLAEDAADVSSSMQDADRIARNADMDALVYGQSQVAIRYDTDTDTQARDSIGYRFLSTGEENDD